ncbi:MAG: sulfite exporter TauE/SafE family protein [Magnetococcales bacterium]|nr:sulfite exporter TauE/SafE family protein [Magnetococcales bacterium]
MTDLLHPAEWGAIWAILALGAAVQGVAGFGITLIAAPLLLLLAPSLMPGPLMLGIFLLTLLTWWRERHEARLGELGWAFVGRLPGTFAAGAALAWLPTQQIDLLMGILILIAVPLSTGRWQVRPTIPNLIAAGALSGFMGTTTAMGGPPMAILYQNRPGPTLRSSLAAYFTIGVVISLATLAMVGRFGRRELIDGVLLMPPIAFGFLASGRITPWIDRGRVKPAVLALCTLAGFMILGRSIG